MNTLDRGYKKLLSQPTIVRQIIETFVEEDWVPLLDLTQMERTVKLSALFCLAPTVPAQSPATTSSIR